MPGTIAQDPSRGFGEPVCLYIPGSCPAASRRPIAQHLRRSHREEWPQPYQARFAPRCGLRTQGSFAHQLANALAVPNVEPAMPAAGTGAKRVICCRVEASLAKKVRHIMILINHGHLPAALRKAGGHIRSQLVHQRASRGHVSYTVKPAQEYQPKCKVSRCHFNSR